MNNQPIHIPAKAAQMIAGLLAQRNDLDVRLQTAVNMCQQMANVPSVWVLQVLDDGRMQFIPPPSPQPSDDNNALSPQE